MNKKKFPKTASEETESTIKLQVKMKMAVPFAITFLLRREGKRPHLPTQTI